MEARRVETLVDGCSRWPRLWTPSLDDWLPEGHTARFVSEIERRCQVDVAFRWLSANTTPGYRSVSRFRHRHLAALDDLFAQVSLSCSNAGLVKLGRVASDGTQLNASASKHTASPYGRLVTRGQTHQLLIMLQRINDGLGAAGLGTPEQTLADAGYCSTNEIDADADADAAADTGRDRPVTTGRLKHHEQVPDAPRGRIPNNATSRERMARRFRTGRVHTPRDLSQPAQTRQRSSARHLLNPPERTIRVLITPDTPFPTANDPTRQQEHST